MAPVPFKAVLSTVDTPLPAFREVLEAAVKSLIQKQKMERGQGSTGMLTHSNIVLARILLTLGAVCGLALSYNKVHCPDAQTSGRRHQSALRICLSMKM